MPNPRKHVEHVRLWLRSGGFAVLEEASEAAGEVVDADNFGPHLRELLGDAFLVEMMTRNAWSTGSLTCVHAGVLPHKAESTLAMKRSGHSSDPFDRHWAWVQDSFLEHQRGWHEGKPLDPQVGGKLVVHGHTQALTKPHHGLHTPAELVRHLDKMSSNARLNLDAGAAQGATMAGAVLSADGYRLFAQPGTVRSVVCG